MSDLNEWLDRNSGSSHPGVAFPDLGDTVVGRIIETPRVVEAPDLNGNMAQSLVIAVEAQTGCTAKTGKKGAYYPITAGDTVSVWVKAGAMASAVQAALVAAGAKGLQEGGTFAIKYSSDGVQKKAGFNPPKLYTAQYVAPTPAVGVEGLIGTEAKPSASSLI